MCNVFFFYLLDLLVLQSVKNIISFNGLKEKKKNELLCPRIDRDENIIKTKSIKKKSSSHRPYAPRTVDQRPRATRLYRYNHTGCPR